MKYPSDFFESATSSKGRIFIKLMLFVSSRRKKPSFFKILKKLIKLFKHKLYFRIQIKRIKLKTNIVLIDLKFYLKSENRNNL